MTQPIKLNAMANMGGDRSVAATIFSEDGKFLHAVERRCLFQMVGWALRPTRSSTLAVASL